MFLKLTSKSDGYNNNIQIKNIISKLNKYFSIDYSKSFFEPYPFSNEQRYLKVLDELNITEVINLDKKIRVAILFGESNFISMLPELSKHADLILLANIEPKLHQHTQHLLKYSQYT